MRKSKVLARKAKSLDDLSSQYPRPSRAKLFQNGRSQAVRLPKEYRFEGSEVGVGRAGNAVSLAERTGPV